MLGIGPAERRLTRGSDRLTIFFPGRTIDPQIGFLEWNEIPPHIEVMLKAGNVSLVSVIPLQFVQDLNEDFQDRRRMIAADPIKFLVNVEQDAARRNLDRVGKV